jgi:hypothetical protein
VSEARVGAAGPGDCSFSSEPGRHEMPILSPTISCSAWSRTITLWSASVNQRNDNHSGRRPDERIREEICERLRQGSVNAEDVEIAVSEGRVLLTGTVDTLQDKRFIQDLAENILGGKDITNSLTVGEKQGATVAGHGSQSRGDSAKK